MTLEQFNFLVVNVMAVVSQTFSLRCNELNSVLAEENEESSNESLFDLKELHENFDYQTIIDAGYRDLETLADKLTDAFHLIDQEQLNRLFSALPKNLPNLSAKLSGEQLKTWITHQLANEDSNELTELHQLLFSAFNQENEAYDLIREAIANNDVSILLNLDSSQVSDAVSVDDLITAAEIESFEVFEWLIANGNIHDEQKIELLCADECVMDPFVWKRMKEIIDPNEQVVNSIRERAEKNGQSELIELMNNI